MGIQIGAKPDSGFDDPLGMLRDCHRRIEHFLNILDVVAAHARGRELNAEESAAVQAALRYFHEGGRRHTADEEQSLFPRLRLVCPETDFPEVSGLEGDHRDAEELHAVVEELYRRWMQSGKLNNEDEGRLCSAMERMKKLYREHITLEDDVLFPRAAEWLSTQALAEIGQEFRARCS
jgi:hemerythrin-like domain-containing protein